MLATRYGASAVAMISKKQFGGMVALKGNDIVGVPLDEVEGKLRTVPEDHPHIYNSRRMDVCFGDGKRL